MKLRLTHYVLAGLISTFTSFAMGDIDGDLACQAEAETARLACTTADGRAGMSPAQARRLDELKREAARTNDDEASLKGQSTQYENRRNNNSAMAELSDMKAQACMSTLTLCSGSCGYSEGRHAKKAMAASVIGISGLFQLHDGHRSNRAASRSVCDGYKDNVARALDQARRLRENVAVNTKGHLATSASHLGEGSVESRGGDSTANAGCMAPGGGLHDSCKNFRRNEVANGDSDDRRSGKFKPKGFSDAEWASSSSSEAGSSDQRGGLGTTGSSVNGAGRSAGDSARIGSSEREANRGSAPASGGRDPASAESKTHLAGAKKPRENARAPSAGSSRTGAADDISDSNGADSRSPSGMSLEPRDGITGPMGLSIFQKVSRRYQIVRPEMIPD